MSAEDARKPSPTTDERVGAVLSGRYRLDRLIGEGGMGRVYEAVHVAMRKIVAVKVLHRRLTAVPEVVARFEREAMAAANIDHPNVAAATDFGKLEDGSVFLVLEYVRGRSLRDEMVAPLDLDRALHITRQIASALATAHDLGIVHRDLKPENVMLVEKGTDRDFVKVLDFGVARVPVAEQDQDEPVSTGKPITRAGMVFGTPEYMPPEQALGQEVDARADLYALGVIAYEMLTGTRPFRGSSQVEVLGQQLAHGPPPIAERAPGVEVPPVIEQLLHMLVARDVAQRVQSALELVAAIDQFRGGPPVRAGSPSSGHLRVHTGSVPDGRDSGSIPDIVTTPGSIPDAADLLRPGSLPGVESSPELRTGSIPDWSESAADGVIPPSSPNVPGIGTWFENLRPGLPGPFRRVPAAAWLGVGGLVVLALVFLGAALVAGSIGEATPSGAAASSARGLGAGKSATDSELSEAKASGTRALAALSMRYPEDTSVLLELAKSYELDRDPSKAAHTIGRALAIDTELSRDPWIASALWRAAQSKDAEDAAFQLLEGPMGEKGADILYDLVVTRGIRAAVVGRAEKFLRAPGLEGKASPALAVAVALHYARTCEESRALLGRARSHADQRALTYLRRLEKRSGCGRRGSRDCYPCLRGDSQLRDAIEAIEKRKRG